MIVLPLGVGDQQTPTADRHLASVALWRVRPEYFLFEFCGENGTNADVTGWDETI